MTTQTETADPMASVVERLTKAETSGVSSYECLGRRFVVRGNVFPPTHFQSTGIFTEGLDYVPATSFLEIGCGVGITAITAALAGCFPVVASDISEDAVNNTRENVILHGVTDSVSVRLGDLFDVLKEDERFDVIFWNSNFVFVPDDYVYTKDIYRAFCDAGYHSHERFLREAPRYLSENGKILLGFSGQGEEEALHQLLMRNGYTSESVLSKDGEGANAHRYEILHLHPIKWNHAA